MIRRLAVLLLLALPQAEAATPSDYAIVLPIDTAAAAGSSAFRIELTPDAYAWVQDASLRDLEVFNAAGQSVPLARFSTEPAATVQEMSANLPALALPPSLATSASDLRLVIDRDADGRLRRIDAGEQTPAKAATRDWLLDAGTFDHAIDHIVLAWTEPAAGIVARFAIDGSDDLQSWRSIGNATVLSLEQQGARIERRDIAIGGARAKYLRLHRLDDGADLSGLTAVAHAIERGRAAPAREWIRADAIPVAADTSASSGARFDYALKAALPIDGARIELGDDNALAPITLLARRPRANNWSHFAQLTAFRLRQGDETIRNGDIDLTAPSRIRELRIESRVPLASTPQLTVSYRPESFVFLAQGGGPYVLAVGSVRAQRADYPIDTALASLRASLGKDWQPPLAALGAVRTSGGDAVLQPPPPPLPWRRWVLWGVLIGGALLVAGFAMSLLRGQRSD